MLAVVAGALIGAVAIMRPAREEEPRTPLPLLAATETPAPSQALAILAPNGKMTLTTKEKKEEGAVIYTFSVSDSENGVSKEIFTKTLSVGDRLEVPYNTFSPDNKYIFLEETSSGGVNYFVVSTAADGAIFNVSDLFKEKLSSDFVITDVTGWGGVNLLIVNTDKAGGGIGPSFWFEPPSRSFIRLSTRFH